MTTSVFIAAANALITLSSAVVMIYYIRMLTSGLLKTELERCMAVGVAGLAGTWMIHRAYWVVQRYLESSESTGPVASAMYDDYSIITVVPLLFVTFFYGFHLSPVLNRVYGEKWRLRWMMTIISCFAIAVIALS